MDFDTQDLSCSHEILTDFIIQKGAGNENAAVKEYLKQVNYPPVQDFKEGNIFFVLLRMF